MQSVAHLDPPGTDIDDTPLPRASPGPAPMAVWVHDGLVCVTVVDVPVHESRSGVCRCAACHADEPADWATRFF
jgi:hypothetical protein